MCYTLFLFYKLLNMFQKTMCPSSGADECVVLSPRVGIVPWLQEGCQNRLACSVSTEEFVAHLRNPQWNRLAGSVSIEEFVAQLRNPQWNRLAGSVSIEEFVAQLRNPQWNRLAVVCPLRSS